MAASVGGYPPLYNTDPGVYEPECDWREEQPAFPDTQQFVEEFTTMQQQQEAAAAAESQAAASSSPAANESQAAPPEPELPLTGDYRGLGGPQTVPLYSDHAFERPSANKAQTNSILRQIFMEPTESQISAYNRVILRGKVAQDKYRLKWTILLHYALVFCMISKLMPEILDKLDIFILEIEELFVPRPYFWEWMWILSVPVTFFGLSACKKSNMIAIRRFMLGSLVFSLLPVLIGMAVHAPEVYTFLFAEDEDSAEDAAESEVDQITMWQGYPYSVLWYAFFFLALQVHCYELYFANCLMKAWMPDLKKTM